MMNTISEIKPPFTDPISFCGECGSVMMFSNPDEVCKPIAEVMCDNDQCIQCGTRILVKRIDREVVYDT